MREIRVDFAGPRPTPIWFSAAALVIVVPVIGWQISHLVEINKELRVTRGSTEEIQREISQAHAQRREAEERALEASQTPEARSWPPSAAFR